MQTKIIFTPNSYWRECRENQKKKPPKTHHANFTEIDKET